MDFNAKLEEFRQRHLYNKDYSLTININTSINNDFSSHNCLSNIFYRVQHSNANTLVLDISPSAFIAANQFATLGCILDTFINQEKKVCLSPNISQKHLNLIKRNGFGKLFSLAAIPDSNNTVIPYRNFDVNNINEYDMYLTINLFGSNNLPQMSSSVADYIRDYLLEIFKNVKDHTSSTKVYTCGQFFPKSSLLYFSIVDSGETIPYNVTEYHKKHSLPSPANTLKWALERGNTTLADDGPRGIGLYLIKEFVYLNKGYFYIVSGNETYEINPISGDNYECLEYNFPGTIVTIAFNLDANATYCLTNENINF